MQVTNTVNHFLCEEAIEPFCSLPFYFKFGSTSFHVSCYHCSSPADAMSWLVQQDTFYQANCFVTTSCIQSCLTQSTGDQKWCKVWSQLAKGGNTILKTNMKEGGLQSPSHHWLGKENTSTVCNSKPVTNQSSRKEYGHIYTPFGSGGGNSREGENSRGPTPQTTKVIQNRVWQLHAVLWEHLWEHLSKYSAGQSLPHGTPSVPKNSAALEINLCFV